MDVIILIKFSIWMTYRPFIIGGFIGVFTLIFIQQSIGETI